MDKKLINIEWLRDQDVTDLGQVKKGDKSEMDKDLAEVFESRGLLKIVKQKAKHGKK